MKNAALVKIHVKTLMVNVNVREDVGLTKTKKTA